MVTWKRDLASGLIVLVPVVVTLWVILWIYGFIASTAFLAVVDQELLDGLGLGWAAEFLRVVLTLFVSFLLVLAVGYLMRTAVGSVVESTIDNIVNQVPGVRIIYNASKMAAETALAGTDSLQEPVRIEPWPGMRLTAFKTGKQTEDGRQIVFMPTAPNITTGFVIEVKEEDIVETNERAEEALTRLLSAGLGDEPSSRSMSAAFAEDRTSDLKEQSR